MLAVAFFLYPTSRGTGAPVETPHCGAARLFSSGDVPVVHNNAA